MQAATTSRQHNTAAKLCNHQPKRLENQPENRLSCEQKQQTVAQSDFKERIKAEVRQCHRMEQQQSTSRTQTATRLSNAPVKSTEIIERPTAILQTSQALSLPPTSNKSAVTKNRGNLFHAGCNALTTAQIARRKSPSTAQSTRQSTTEGSLSAKSTAPNISFDTRSAEMKSQKQAKVLVRTRASLLSTSSPSSSVFRLLRAKGKNQVIST